jgi:hypothetical protein
VADPVSDDRSPATATVSATDRTATQHPNSSGSDRDSNQSRGPARSRLRWIHGGVGFQPAHGSPALGETAARRAGCPPHHGKHRHGRSVGSGDSDSDSGSVRGRFSEQRRGPRRPRIPDTATGHGVGHGRCRFSPTTMNQPPRHGPTPIEECFGLGRSLVVDLASKLQQPQGGTRLES